MKNSLILTMIVLVAFASVAFAAAVDYETPNSINEYIQVKNTSAAALGKGAPVVLEASEYTTNGIVGINGADSTTQVVIGVLAETLEVNAVGIAITYGFGSVLVDEAVDLGDNLGTTTTAGEADDNNTNAQSMFAVALAATTGRNTVASFIRCK